ncbi:Asp-tRNA(Asn)/Glu-tRNA(Gln) amidotransferase GatCAB subunit A [Methylovirgula ligni]|uniref:Aspartyl-tRNA(Asn)/glutamyl-tRNA(Gln) amidotransferase subunit A n=1 Tax=Methylovirgula ligni TaxID=569860 RepID=A0A3D9Z6G7_9HYPH|nr:AtzE family amidohydrolase [Methylovirgula ligni]QAY95532.1 Asp-tRNA(Asn)/Glu-tRNA(Gln) amidotransferase GatCAB subunit A [Methylovirgula ligni]REF89129.1 aspartyl-tRNA(Asn)/glutamyl-tRNA(Gln) amidotransferase subunit A [Methylovirgula ligni]
MTLDVLRALAGEIAIAVSSGQVSARAVTDAALARIATRNPQLNAFTDVTRDRALAKAAVLDAGAAKGPLAGVPFAVKNLYDIAGLVTRAGSKINRDNAAAGDDALVVEKLDAAGAVLLGALDMDEYAYGFTGENVHDGNSLNPHDPSRMTGGSSGGSAAAVASGMVAFALGSDTNGSIRVPASLCGLFGLKPTYGRLSRSGVFPFVASFDHVGVLARAAADLASVYDAMQGRDVADPAQAPRAAERVLPLLGQGASGLRIAVAGDYFRRGGRPECFAAVDAVAAALGATREVVLPAAAAARAAAFVITAAEGAAFHLPRLRERPQDFDAAVRDRLFAGAMIPAESLLRAQKLRAWFHRRVAALFEEVDIILTPATPCRAPLSGQKTIEIEGTEVTVRANLGIYTQPISFIGLPAVTVPLWTEGETLPIGVQIIGPPWREDLVLRVAYELERKGVARAPVA